MALDSARYVNEELGPSVIRGRNGFAALAAIALVILVAAFLYGQSARATGARNKAIALEGENSAFCTGLGLDPATAVYARCTDGLMGLRRRDEDRQNLESVGIL